MKRIILFLIVGMLIFIVSGCGLYHQSENSNSISTTMTDYNVEVEKITLSEDEISKIRNCKLFVEGTNITDGNYVIINDSEKYAEIPILAVLRCYGATINNASDHAIMISLNGIEFTLYTDRQDLGIAIMPGGSTSVRKIVNNDLIFDNHSIRVLLRNIGNINITIDYENMEIWIEKD